MSIHVPEIALEYLAEYIHGCLLILFSLGTSKKIFIMRIIGSQCQAHILCSASLFQLFPTSRGEQFTSLYKQERFITVAALNHHLILIYGNLSSFYRLITQMGRQRDLKAKPNSILKKKKMFS